MILVLSCWIITGRKSLEFQILLYILNFKEILFFFFFLSYIGLLLYSKDWMFCRREDRGKRKEGEGTFFLKKNTRESLLRFLVTNKYIFRGLFMSVSSGLFHSLSQLHSMEKLSSILCAFYQWTFQLSHSFIHSFTHSFVQSFIHFGCYKPCRKDSIYLSTISS